MNKQIISNSPTFEWILRGNCIWLKKDKTVKAISAADIVRFEYKEKKIFKGIEVRNRPSETLKNLKINRFPAKLSLELEMPAGKNGKPLLKPIISSDNFRKIVKKIPDTDQLIIGDQWFSLFEDNIIEINNYLEKLL